MLNSISLVLLSFGGDAKTEIQNNIRTKPVPRVGKFGAINKPLSASGRLANSIEFHLNEDTLLITANGTGAYAFTAEYGRGPGAVSKEGVESLKAWMQLRGIEPSALWPIVQKLRKEGSLLHQQVKKSGILDVFNGEQSIENLQRRIATGLIPELTSQILRAWQP